MVQYKLTYFPIRGRAETARLILHYANVPFDDNRVAQEEWPKVKPTTPFGQIPVLEIDGKQLAQSYAINRFLARKFDLAGKDDWESAQLDSIADFKTDLHNEIRPYLQVVRGRAEGDKEKLFREIFEPAFEKFATILIKLLKESGSGFYGKSGVSWVDFELAEAIYTMNGLHHEFLLEKSPELVKHMEKVYALPQLKDYLETRPKSPF